MAIIKYTTILITKFIDTIKFRQFNIHFDVVERKFDDNHTCQQMLRSQVVKFKSTVRLHGVDQLTHFKDFVFGNN